MKDAARKRTYATPVLERVDLVPDEAVLISCKIQGGGPGPTAPTPHCGGTPTYCVLGVAS